MKITTYLFLSLFSLFLSQNIITSWNYDKVAMYDLQKINTFLSKVFTTPLDIPYEFSIDSLKVDKIKLIKIETNLYDSLINYNTGLLLLAPNKITLSFNFSYSDTGKGSSGESTLTLNVLTFKLKVTNEKTSEKKVNFEIKMTSPIENYSIPGFKDKDLLKELINLIFNGFNDKSVLSQFIPEKMETELYNYYSEFYKKNKDFNLQTQKFFGNVVVPIKNNEFIYFCEDVLGDYKNAFCFYSGSVSNNENKNDKEDKILLPLKNERFSHNEEDLYVIYVNNELVKNSMDYIVKNYFEKNAKIYNNKTNVKELSYDFTVGSLQKVFKGLENLKKEDAYDCEIYVESGNLNEVVYRVKVNIRDQSNNNFEMRVTSGLTLDISILKSIRFNMCIKETNTMKVEILSSTIQPQVEISDLNGLKKSIEESFDFKQNPICLNDKGISLKNYFTELTKAYIQDDGLYFEGPQLYQ